MSVNVRTDWSVEEVRTLYHTPLLELVFEAASVHRRHHDPRAVQCCTLLSVKTGGCSEDCAYCSQSARYHTGVALQRLLSVDEVRAHAARAREAGSTRFCMGAAWRSVKDGRDFEQFLAMVREVRALGLEACATLGMLSAAQARRLAEAGLTAYNHNLDTSPDFYSQIVHTHTYEERLETLRHVREAGIAMCCGGIIGMGETHEQRIRFLHTLATLAPHPESVPINVLVPIEGTPLADQPPLDPLDLIRMIAASRILMPAARVRLSAGRLSLAPEAQALAFLAGANSIFTGETLLTTPNPRFDDDLALLDRLGLRAMGSSGADPASAHDRR